MKNDRSRWGAVWSAAAGLALMGGLNVATFLPSGSRDAQAVPQAPEVRLDVTQVSGGSRVAGILPLPEVPGIRVAGILPLPQVPGVRVAGILPLPEVPGARVA